MREIEIKIKTDDLEQVARKLAALGCEISEPVIQADHNFVHRADTRWFETPDSKEIYPRIRVQPGQPLRLTAKQAIENLLDNREHEIEIDNFDEAAGLLEMFGYIPGVTVKKTRRKCTYQDYTITLDDVEGLGQFVEIEHLVEDGDAIQTQKEMRDFAREQLGLEGDQDDLVGYDILTYYKSLEDGS